MHLVRENLLSNKQHGFINKRSTVTQLLSYLDNCVKSISRGLVVDVIYFDFVKAFDTVPHRRLLRKLKVYGIRKQASKRYQIVKINGVNDAIQLQHDIKAMEAWSNDWLLKFHPGKCHVFTLGKFKKISNMFTHTPLVIKFWNMVPRKKKILQYLTSLSRGFDLVENMTSSYRETLRTMVSGEFNPTLFTSAALGLGISCRRKLSTRHRHLFSENVCMTTGKTKDSPFN